MSHIRPVCYLLAQERNGNTGEYEKHIGGMYSMVLKWVESGMEVPSAVLIEKWKDGFTSPEF